MFKSWNRKDLIRKHPDLFGVKRVENIPEEYRVHYISAIFVETVKWWIDNGMQETPERIAEYFLAVV